MAATMTCRRLNGLLFLALTLLLSTVANAHTPERTLQPVARHDGVAKRAGPYNIEFVSEGSCASIYMHSKSNARLGTSRTSATITVHLAGEKREITLNSDGGNRLRGCGEVAFNDISMLVIRLHRYGKEDVAVLLNLDQARE